MTSPYNFESTPRSAKGAKYDSQGQARSAKGAKYDSQGQARSASPLVKRYQIKGALKVRNIIAGYSALSELHGS